METPSTVILLPARETPNAAGMLCCSSCGQPCGATSETVRLVNAGAAVALCIVCAAESTDIGRSAYRSVYGRDFSSLSDSTTPNAKPFEHWPVCTHPDGFIPSIVYYDGAKILGYELVMKQYCTACAAIFPMEEFAKLATLGRHAGAKWRVEWRRTEDVQKLLERTAPKPQVVAGKRGAQG